MTGALLPYPLDFDSMALLWMGLLQTLKIMKAGAGGKAAGGVGWEQVPGAVHGAGSRPWCRTLLRPQGG